LIYSLQWIGDFEKPLRNKLLDVFAIECVKFLKFKFHSSYGLDKISMM